MYTHYEQNQKMKEIFFPKILYRNRNNLISDVSKGLTHFKIKVKKMFLIA